jgi:hypothetical protein
MQNRKRKLKKPTGDADLTGRKFGKLKVKRWAGVNHHGNRVWLCKCACRKTRAFLVTTPALKSGNTQSCGCRRAALSRKRPQCVGEDLTGRLFAEGTIRVLRRGPLKQVGDSRRRYWVCQCPCGAEFLAVATALRSGRVTSCGCGVGWKAKRRACYAARGADRGLVGPVEFDDWLRWIRM